MLKYKPVSHVIFDVDGLLIDTESLYTLATQKVLDNYGKTFTWDVKVKMMGKTAHDAAVIAISELDLPMTPQEFQNALIPQYEELFPTGKLMPGAKKLVHHLSNQKIPIALATGSDAHNFDLKTKNHKEFFSLFSHCVLTSSDPEVKRGKPAPDAFLICASRFPDKPASDKILVFEDAPNGVQAAVSAGMQVVMVPDPQIDKNLTKEATLVLSSLEEFCPEDFGLPKYEN